MVGRDFVDGEERHPPRLARRLRSAERGATWTPDQAQSVIRTLLKTYKGLSTADGPAFLEEIAAATGSGRCPLIAAASPWMTWEQVRTLKRSGHSIGAHTVTHPLLARCSREQQRFEIVESKRRLEEVLGATVESFSYPVGTADAFTAETEELMQQAGIRWAFNFQGGYLDACCVRSADRFSLPRIAMEPELSQPRFRALNTLPALFARA